jgi:DNA-binding SARP family transcriptional activator
MLGVLDLRAADGQEVDGVLTQPRRLALLIRLAVTATNGFQRRDRLLAMFWPEHDIEHARAALNRSVYYLRQVLGQEVLLSRGSEEIGVSAALWSDVAAFESAAEAGRHQEALELYRGDLLEGFFIAAAPDFEQWLDAERHRLRLLACRIARELAHAEEAAANYSQPVHWARW